jgi:hypothetical protein
MKSIKQCVFEVLQCLCYRSRACIMYVVEMASKGITYCDGFSLCRTSPPPASGDATEEQLCQATIAAVM